MNKASIEAAPLSYDVVMATRNRPDAVALSLPLILNQSRAPQRVIIVDSSDDPGPIQSMAEHAAKDAPCAIEYTHTEAGLTYQRNLGLAQATSPIVVFPDDDSLLHPGTAEAILEVYEADPDEHVAGVCAVPAERPPVGLEAQLGHFDAESSGPVRATIRKLRQSIKEALAATNPFLTVGNQLNARHTLPPAVARLPVAKVPYMTGFRMSFRRTALGQNGFDETLRRYGWFEDIDASFAVLQKGSIVVAQKANIYHHRAAAKRDNGHRMGLWAILNRGYVVMKHVRANPEVFQASREARRLQLYCQYRTVAYRILARDAYGRDRARGAAEGLSGLPQLMHASSDTLSTTYGALEQKAEATTSA